MTNETLLLLAMAVPFAGALGIGLAGRRPNLREGVTLVSAGAVMFAVFSITSPRE